MHLLFEFQHANAILNLVLVRAEWHQSLRKRQWIYISVQRARPAICRLGRRLARFIVSIDAMRQEQSRYRCNAQLEKITPL
jgi:hypothetical protein